MSHEKTAAVVNALFERLIAINPAYKQSWPNEQSLAATKREWVFAFIDAEITTTEQLKKGLSKCRLAPSPFIPSPGQFIEWCKVEPEDIGAPAVEKAYDEAVKNAYPDGTDKKWSHPCVKHAYHATGSFFLRVEPKLKSFPVFLEHYQHAIESFCQGRILDQLENHRTPQNYQEYVGRMKADIALGLKKDATIISFEEWSKSNNN